MARKNKRAITKKQAQKRHAIARAGERYGLDLTPSQLKAAIRKIQQGEARFLWKQSLTRSVFIVDIDTTPCVAVYDPSRNSIRTFLPPIAPRQTLGEYRQQVEQYFLGWR